jgi:hypothetical protein
LILFISVYLARDFLKKTANQFIDKEYDLMGQPGNYRFIPPCQRNKHHFNETSHHQGENMPPHPHPMPPMPPSAPKQHIMAPIEEMPTIVEQPINMIF